eukprot:CAMPEP_0114304812 /NCGR_PEP_ID=MMETSP0059-20121206/15994_1 /TAXON_ID=36894 /ORGANISM="Pyramimonas parkeae, Strain CCMP726" /LENGTH=36 /DNA_ID= /DNA_START= /DNA_END= /DNA_ORIENTATION=
MTALTPSRVAAQILNSGACYLRQRLSGLPYAAVEPP